MTLNLVKGEFSSLEDALREQVKALEAEVKKLQVDKELLKGRIEELHHRHFEEEITFEDD